MSKNVLVCFLLTLAACQSARPLPRIEIPPSVAMAPPAQAVRAATDEAATKHWLEQEIARQRDAADAPKPLPAPQSPSLKSTSEDATRAWLLQTIEQQRAVNPEPLQYQYVEAVQPVYVGREVRFLESPAGCVRYPYGYRAEPCYETPFPVYTVFGAGVGALIGGNNHNAGGGAAIGAGVGLLLDLGRWQY
jgi:hypothetical protein